MRAVEPALEWCRQDYLMAEAVNMLRLLVWAQSKDGQKGRNRPKMVEPPHAWVRKQAESVNQEKRLSATDYRKQLAQARRQTNVS
jgi:hypothetical protein